MPALYSAAVVTPAAAANAAFCVLRAAAGDRARIREITVTVNAATASSVGLIRTTANGTPTTSVLGQAWDSSDTAAVTSIDSAWSAAPTIGSIYLRRQVIPATIGQGPSWVFPSGLILPASGGIALWNYGASAGSALSVTFVWEE